jgi:hypothetical protein
MDLIDFLYTDLSSPVAYAGVNALYEEAHRQDSSITRELVNEYLEKKSVYTLHKPRRLRFKRATTVPSGYFSDFQVDLADFQSLAKYNQKYRYLLVGVEVLSRQVYTSPVKSKSTGDMKKAFDHLFAPSRLALVHLLRQGA